MRRDPLSIVSILMQTMESLNENEEYNFNELSNRSKLHWETIKKYVLLIKYIQSLAPLIEILGNKIIIIKKHSNENLDFLDKLLLTLFYSKAFHENTAIELLDNDSILIDLINDNLIQETRNKKFYLTDSGKRRAFKIFKQITNTIYEDYLQLQSTLPPEATDFHEDITKEVRELRNEVQLLSSKVEHIENKIQNPPDSTISSLEKPAQAFKKPTLDNTENSINIIPNQKHPLEEDYTYHT